MRLPVLAALCASGALFAVPAFAQATAATPPNTGQRAAGHGMSERQSIIDGLQKAGFTKIRIEPEVFVVHAVDQQGDPVLMRIGPDSMTEITDVPMQQATGTHGGNTARAPATSSGTSKD